VSGKYDWSVYNEAGYWNKRDTLMYKQEMMCDFLGDNSNMNKMIRLVNDATGRKVFIDKAIIDIIEEDEGNKTSLYFDKDVSYGESMLVRENIDTVMELYNKED